MLLSELLDGMPQRGFKAFLADGQAEGGQQFPQLSIGRAKPLLKFSGDVVHPGVAMLSLSRLRLRRVTWILKIGQCLGQRIVQFPGNDTALIHQGFTPILVNLVLNAECNGDPIREGLQQLVLPIERFVAGGQVNCENAVANAPLIIG